MVRGRCWPVLQSAAMCAPRSRPLATAEQECGRHWQGRGHPESHVQDGAGARDLGGAPPLRRLLQGSGRRLRSYTLHFSDVIAWEIARFGYALDFDTNLKTQLLNLGTQQTAFSREPHAPSPPVRSSGARPYFKAALSNRSVAHGEFYFLVGGGAFDLKSGSSSTVQPAVDAGLGVRFFLTQVISLRFEGRENLLISSSPTSVVDLTFGVSFNFGASD